MEKRSPTKLSTRLLVLLCMMGLGFIVATLALTIVKEQDMLLILTVQDLLVNSALRPQQWHRRPLPFHGSMLADFQSYRR